MANQLPVIDLLAVMDTVAVVMREDMLWINWTVVQITSQPSKDQLHRLIQLRGLDTVHDWLSCGPMIFASLLDGDFTADPVPLECEFVGVARDGVVATIKDANQCSMRARVAYVIVRSLMCKVRFCVSSKADGKGHVVGVGLVGGDAVLRNPNLVLMWRRNANAPYDDAIQLHPSAKHELLFVDVSFGSGVTRRLYIELTPGQIDGFATDATKAVFWEPPPVYSNLLEIVRDDAWFHEFRVSIGLKALGWMTYYDVMEKVCEKALKADLRHMPLDYLSRFGCAR